MKSQVLHTLHYFSIFNYAVTIDELFFFHSKKITKTNLQRELLNLVKQNKIKRSSKKIEKSGKKTQLYTLPQYTISSDRRYSSYVLTQRKLAQVERYIKTLSILPSIQLVGISGSLAMNNAQENDDIDLFIITSNKRMWITRLISIILAEFIGIRRRYNQTQAQDKVCLNLFFDISSLQLPRQKQTEYGAHEVLQMKPVVNKKNTYEKFLRTNEWVFSFFPNAKKVLAKQWVLEDIPQIKNKNMYIFIGDWFEKIARALQLFFINKHKTTELISDTQLWFFPKDYEKRLRRKLVIGVTH